MKIRKRKNSSGTYSIQIYKKEGNKSIHIKTIGSSSDPYEISRFYEEGLQYIEHCRQQLALPLKSEKTEEWFNTTANSIQKVLLLGPQLILSKIYDEVGFNRIPEDLLKQLIISRIIHPGSKLQTARYLQAYRGEYIDVHQIYRYMDKIHTMYKKDIERISYEHTKAIIGEITVVFYDVTTIYFEASKEDELRIAGFSKDGKHKHPQIILGLLVSYDGYPLAYNIYKGNTYEGDTLIPIIHSFEKRFGIEKLMVIADSGLLSKKNLRTLEEEEYEFIIGARIKNESKTIKDKILEQDYSDGKYVVIEKSPSYRLIVQYSSKRAKKDKKNREKGMKRLEKLLKAGKLTKAHINNRGYNKYLQLNGEISITIDYKKYDNDKRWDGLKGYITNANLPIDEVIKNYKELWKIERAFRISKTDLRVRPIYHRLQKRIETHICISFAAYKIYRELERKLKLANREITVEKAIELMKTIYGIELKNPINQERRQMLFTTNHDQDVLLLQLKIFDIQQGWLE